jgi:hypothetical protein
MDPLTLAVGGALAGAGWLAGRAHRRPSSPTLHTICSCDHGYGTHKDGQACEAQVERDHPYSQREPYESTEWVPCPCLTYDGPEPLPKVWMT